MPQAGDSYKQVRDRYDIRYKIATVTQSKSVSA